MAAAGIYTATSAEARLLDQLRAMERERDQYRQQYNARTDENIRLSAELAKAKEELAIALRRAERAVAERDNALRLEAA